ncbi:tyrosine-type recombinase/integrase [Vibrio metschnikovii]|nr:tyrosine-type recombinase/integrase [Vibrio metschnikovii]
MEIIAANQLPNVLNIGEAIDAEGLSGKIEAAIKSGYTYKQIAESHYFQSLAKKLLDDFEQEKDIFSPQTKRRLEYSWCLFVSWCEQTNKHALPASPNDVAEYLAYRSKTCHRNTLNVDQWAISTMLKAAGCPDSVDKLIVKRKMRAATKRKVRVELETIKQATPFRDHDLDALIERFANSNVPNELRDLAMLSVAYESLLRASEMVRIKLNDLKFNHDDSATLIVPFTKTNQSGKGVDSVFLSPQCGAHIKRYLEKAGIDDKDGGYLFRAIYRSGRTKKGDAPITTKAVENVFLKAWFILNPDVDQSIPLSEIKDRYQPFTAHSARVGAAQDLLEQGFDSLQVRQAGRWQSDTMILRYGQHILAEQSAMAKSRKKKLGVQ